MLLFANRMCVCVYVFCTCSELEQVIFKPAPSIFPCNLSSLGTHFCQEEVILMFPPPPFHPPALMGGGSTVHVCMKRLTICCALFQPNAGLAVGAVRTLPEVAPPARLGTCIPATQPVVLSHEPGPHAQVSCI